MAEDILSEMLKSIERMYAVKEGPWKNTLSFFHPNLKGILSSFLTVNGWIQTNFNHSLVRFEETDCMC